MRTLVTGGTGFIGSQVVRKLLDNNHQVRIFSRGKVNADLFGDRSVDVVSGDLADAQTLIDAQDISKNLFYRGAERQKAIIIT